MPVFLPRRLPPVPPPQLPVPLFFARTCAKLFSASPPPFPPRWVTGHPPSPLGLQASVCGPKREKGKERDLLLPRFEKMCIPQYPFRLRRRQKPLSSPRRNSCECKTSIPGCFCYGGKRRGKEGGGKKRGGPGNATHSILPPPLLLFLRLDFLLTCAQRRERERERERNPVSQP